MYLNIGGKTETNIMWNLKKKRAGAEMRRVYEGDADKVWERGSWKGITDKIKQGACNPASWNSTVYLE